MKLFNVRKNSHLLSIPHERTGLNPLAFAFLFLTLTISSLGEASETFSLSETETIHLNGANFETPTACGPTIRRLQSAVKDYDTAAFFNRSGQAKRTHKVIQKILTAMAPSDPCFTWVYGAEVLFSLDLYNRVATGRSKVLIHLAIYLYQDQLKGKTRFAPLTSALRSEWGGAWKQPNHIMGAYECENTLIYFDPTLRLYDLGAVIAHEMEHLMRDKYAFRDANSPFLSDISSALVLDELLASLHAGYLQLSFQYDSSRDGENSVNPKFFEFDGNGFSFPTRRFRLSGDLELFKKRGHLYRLWSGKVRNDGFLPGKIFSDFFSEVIYPDFLNASSSSDIAHWPEIFDIVSKAYFDEPRPSHEAAGALLRLWYDTDQNYVSPLGSVFKNVSNSSQRGDYQQAWENFWTDLDTRIQEKTSGCLRVKEAILGGSASGYVGSKLGGSHPGGDGGRPTKGGDGGRPTIPVIPCLFPQEGL